MTTRRSRRAADDDETLTIDPMEGAVFADAVGVAGQLSEVLESLAGYDQGSIKAVLFRKPSTGMGAFEWIEEIPPPFDMTAIMQSLKDRFNGGKYRMQIFAGGKTRKNIEFAIMSDPARAAGLIAPTAGNDNKDLFLAMMKMGQDSSDRQMQMMQMMQSQQMQMMQSSQQQMTALLTAMMGSREKASDYIALFSALKPEDKGGGLKETVETIAAIKGLFPNGDASGLGSLDADGLIDGALKLAGPVAGAIGRAMEARRERLDGSPHVGDAAPGASTGLEPAARPLMLARPAPAPEPRLVAEGSGRFPILDGIRADILYFFSRRHDPELAAEAIVGILEPIDAVAEQGINDLVGAFAISPDWKADLAAEGIDLRADPEWADQFLAALIAEWTDPDRGDDDPERGAGDATDLARNGEAGAKRVNGHGGAEPSRQPDD